MKNWGVRPHSLGGWLKHLGISNKEFDKLQAVQTKNKKAKRAKIKK